MLLLLQPGFQRSTLDPGDAVPTLHLGPWRRIRVRLSRWNPGDGEGTGDARLTPKQLVPLRAAPVRRLR